MNPEVSASSRSQLLERDDKAGHTFVSSLMDKYKVRLKKVMRPEGKIREKQAMVQICLPGA